MVLVDDEIQKLAVMNGLITPYHSDGLSNCRYNLRAGRAFSPDTGVEIQIDRYIDGTRKTAWRILPSETLMIMTTESVNIPPDLMASYGQLNRLAQQGLLIVNTSIIEPGYNGPISCFLVNFSKNAIDISLNQEIAKLCFYKLTKPPTSLLPSIMIEDEYRKSLSRAASSYPKSFLDIGGLEKRVEDKVATSVNSSIKFGGILVVFLIFLSSLEPIASKYFFERIGLATATTSQDVLKLRNDMESTKNELASARNDLEVAKHDAEEEEKRVSNEKALAQEVADMHKQIDAIRRSKAQNPSQPAGNGQSR
jgi:deoxycytidine triphosphate deaminase